jgi:hypothetical protein
MSRKSKKCNFRLTSTMMAIQMILLSIFMTPVIMGNGINLKFLFHGTRLMWFTEGFGLLVYFLLIGTVCSLLAIYLGSRLDSLQLYIEKRSNKKVDKN